MIEGLDPLPSTSTSSSTASSSSSSLQKAIKRSSTQTSSSKYKQLKPSNHSKIVESVKATPINWDIKCNPGEDDDARDPTTMNANLTKITDKIKDRCVNIILFLIFYVQSNLMKGLKDNSH